MAEVSNLISESANLAGATKRGTRIVKAGSDMDKNAFLKILAAQLTNQDPMSTQDSSQFVTQMAQFSSMEQMSNLNTTMSLYSANSLIGKGITLKEYDASGLPYTGIVRTVTNKSGNITLGVEINKDNQSKVYDFDFSKVSSVLETPNFTLEGLSTTSSLLAAGAIIGKVGEFKSEEGANIKGLVKGMVKEDGIISFRVQDEASGQIKVVTIDKLITLDMGN